jgi:hypothetical protein
MNEKMQRFDRRMLIVSPLWLLALLGWASLAAGATIRAQVVKSIDFKGAPRDEPLAAAALALGNELYPEIRDYFGANAPESFRVRFEAQLPSNNVALTDKHLIRVNLSWFRASNTVASPLRSPSFAMVLTHEMVHVAQQYGPKVPSYWTEGIADYVRYRLGFSNDWSGPQCSAEYPHYKSGYWCAGAFFLFIDGTYGSNCVRRLCRDFKEKPYSDDLFQEATGKSLGELWNEFQASGFVRERNTRASAEAQDAMAQLSKDFILRLVKEGRLPGFKKGERGRLVLQSLREEAAGEKATILVFLGSKKDSSDTYDYEVAVLPGNGGCKLRKAWRRTLDGRVAEWLKIEGD